MANVACGVIPRDAAWDASSARSLLARVVWYGVKREAMSGQCEAMGMGRGRENARNIENPNIAWSIN